MINKKKKYIGRLTLAVAITSILFSGCGAAQKELAQTDRASYEKISYQTVTVQSGSLTPQTTISLRAQGYTKFSYGATNTELTLEKVNVTRCSPSSSTVSDLSGARSLFTSLTEWWSCLTAR